jgi:hypothetical protein
LSTWGLERPLQTPSLLLNECVIFLDEAHTRGIDLWLPKD